MSNTNKLPSYSDIVIASLGVNNGQDIRNNCAVTAYVALTGEDYGTAEYILGEYAGYRRKGAVSSWDQDHPDQGWSGIRKGLEAMGYTVTKLSFWQYGAKTLITLERDPLLKEGRYLVAVSGGRHAVALVDGKVVDYSQGRRHHIKAIWRVEPTA